MSGARNSTEISVSFQFNYPTNWRAVLSENLKIQSVRDVSVPCENWFLTTLLFSVPYLLLIYTTFLIKNRVSK